MTEKSVLFPASHGFSVGGALSRGITTKSFLARIFRVFHWLPKTEKRYCDNLFWHEEANADYNL